jgi:hypothetical protein
MFGPRGTKRSFSPRGETLTTTTPRHSGLTPPRAGARSKRSLAEWMQSSYGREGEMT